MTDQTHLFKEMQEQPVIIQKLFEKEAKNISDLAATIHQNDISHVMIAARGSSDNVGRYAKYLLGANNEMNVGLAAPSLFTIYR